MRIPACHPLHDFQPVLGMPPMPSLSSPAGYLTVQCRHCSLMGFHRKGDQTIILFGAGSNDRRLAQGCAEHSFAPHMTRPFAKITTPRLSMQGGHFGHLIVGSAHRIVPPPNDDPGFIAGVWVSGPMGPVKLLEGEFLPIRVRNRAPRTRFESPLDISGPRA